MLMSSERELQVIVLEDRPEYMRGLPPGKAEQMEREPFELRVICNPKLRAMDESGARFYEGCLSVPGYQVNLSTRLGHMLADFQALSMYHVYGRTGRTDTKAAGVFSNMQLQLKSIGQMTLICSEGCFSASVRDCKLCSFPGSNGDGKCAPACLHAGSQCHRTFGQGAVLGKSNMWQTGLTLLLLQACVDRYQHIEVSGLTPQGKPVTFKVRHVYMSINLLLA